MRAMRTELAASQKMQFAHGLYATMKTEAVFLRAERHEGGARTSGVSQGEPLETSYGENLYAQIVKGDRTVSKDNGYALSKRECIFGRLAL
ncbi:hypothetical protein SAMN05192539_10246 [Paraburkholderia diazotrophica]|uniref:Uncharacterized protein n=2 Tax=Paraburkholderia diazotrophica TaxID=667676 RepID=A0A1H7CSB8_9BURK|nr:hypothetical protein SAMN05192539_10246 [Paraburkholderia diazotrophica]